MEKIYQLTINMKVLIPVSIHLLMMFFVFYLFIRQLFSVKSRFVAYSLSFIITLFIMSLTLIMTLCEIKFNW